MIIWLASYPRSGNTYVRIILNHVFGVKTYSVYGDKLDIAAHEATKVIVGHQELPENFDYFEARKSKDLYFIKTHEPYSDDYKNDKAIYVLRDGREATVSYYHYFNDFTQNKFSLLEIINGYPFAGVWGDHYYSWLREKKDSVLFLRFEEIISLPESAINKIAEFTGLKPQKGKIPNFNDLCEINPKFFRSGRTDSFKKELSKFEQKYFWLINGQAMRDADYVNNVLELNNQSEIEALFLMHADLIKNKKLNIHEEKIQTINQQLSNNKKIIQNKDDQLQQKNQQLEAKERQLVEKDIMIQKKDQQLQNKERIIQSKDNQLQQKTRLIESKENLIQQKEEQLQNKETQIQQIERQLQEMKNSYSFRVGKIMIFPLSLLKRIFKIKKSFMQ